MVFLSQKVEIMQISVDCDEIFIWEGGINSRTETYWNISAMAKNFLKKTVTEKNTPCLSKKKKNLVQYCSRESLPEEAPKFAIDFDSKFNPFRWWMT